MFPHISSINPPSPRPQINTGLALSRLKNAYLYLLEFTSMLLQNMVLQICEALRGVLYLLPQKAQKLACFVLHLKIINIFLKNNIRILQKIVQETQK